MRTAGAVRGDGIGDGRRLKSERIVRELQNPRAIQFSNRVRQIRIGGDTGDLGGNEKCRKRKKKSRGNDADGFHEAHLTTDEARMKHRILSGGLLETVRSNIGFYCDSKLNLNTDAFFASSCARRR